MRRRLTVLFLSATCVLLLGAAFPPPGRAVDPKMISTCDMYSATDVAGVGDYACVCVRNGDLKVIDISDPTTPNVVGSGAPQDSWAVTVAGSHVYVATGAGLQVVDVSVPTAPAQVGLCTSTATTRRPTRPGATSRSSS